MAVFPPREEWAIATGEVLLVSALGPFPVSVCLIFRILQNEGMWALASSKGPGRQAPGRRSRERRASGDPLADRRLASSADIASRGGHKQTAAVLLSERGRAVDT